jgi:hypothetical protein
MPQAKSGKIIRAVVKQEMVFLEGGGWPSLDEYIFCLE